VGSLRLNGIGALFSNDCESNGMRPTLSRKSSRVQDSVPGCACGRSEFFSHSNSKASSWPGKGICMTIKLDSCSPSLPASHTGDTIQRTVTSRIAHSLRSFRNSRISGTSRCEPKPVPSLFWKALAGLLAFDLLGYGRDFVRMRHFVRDCSFFGKSDGRNHRRVCEAVNYACVCTPGGSNACNARH